MIEILQACKHYRNSLSLSLKYMQVTAWCMMRSHGTLAVLTASKELYPHVAFLVNELCGIHVTDHDLDLMKLQPINQGYAKPMKYISTFFHRS